MVSFFRSDKADNTLGGVSVFLFLKKLTLLFTLFIVCGCSDFLHPVDETGTPTEYSFNYWLLKNNYLYEDELASLPETGDSVLQLYNALKDPFTRYVAPSKSEQETIRMNSSYVAGDVGMRYLADFSTEYPIFIRLVYHNGPAAKAGVPRYGNILKINGQELTGEQSYEIYNKVLSENKNIELLIAYNGDTTTYKMQKETFFAPTVFVDTLYKDSAKGLPGIIFATIEGFKPETSDPDSGTYGELKDFLDSTRNSPLVRVLDLRGNPGGHISQCLSMADLFVPSGTLSTRRWRTFDADGNAKMYITEFQAKPGDPGETGKFIILGDKGSASCAEIFIAAVTETTDIPFVGITTYGKGIGQTTWNTVDKGLAVITNTEFITPKGHSYHGKGIIPKYECKGTATSACAAEIAHKIYGVSIPDFEDNKTLNKQAFEQNISQLDVINGGAIQWVNTILY